ncbi:AB-hydrolase YheT [Clavulina sp. PMI_390]|nr:AB-hydrolase YheT [Clavulina sp. PMI_390]
MSPIVSRSILSTITDNGQALFPSLPKLQSITAKFQLLKWTSTLLAALRSNHMQSKSTPGVLRLRSWIYILLVAAALSYFRRRSSAWSGSVPVTLAHANRTAEVTPGVSILDVVKKCESLYGPKAKYEYPWWLTWGDSQTMWNSLGDHTKVDLFDYDRRYLRVPDNGTLVLDTYPRLESTSPSTPIVVILHGITGSSQEAYTRATVKAVTRPTSEGGPGYRAVVLNFRGCDGAPVTSSRLYHAGETDDFRSVLLYLTHTWPEAPLYAVGFSMGASTLAVYLGQQGGDSPIKAAIAVSNPWNWVEAADWIENGSFFNRYVYGPVLADALKTIYMRNLHAFPSVDWDINTAEVEARKYFTIRWYDDRVTSKIFGFRDAHDYYTQTSSQQYMTRIKVPLLALHSLDDPIVSPHYLPWDDLKHSESIVFASTARGGHVGWFQSGEKGFLKRWYTHPIVDFIRKFQETDPLPKPAPQMTPPDAEGLVHQSDLAPGRVGFLPFDGAKYTTTGRMIQGF